MLSNGWYWSGRGNEAMAYPVDGWEVRCRWEVLPSGRWGIRITVSETDPAPWIPGSADNLTSMAVRPVMEGHRTWRAPNRSVMEELSRRIGPNRVRQMIDCCVHTASTQVSN